MKNLKVKMGTPYKVEKRGKKFVVSNGEKVTALARNHSSASALAQKMNFAYTAGAHDAAALIEAELKKRDAAARKAAATKAAKARQAGAERPKTLADEPPVWVPPAEAPAAPAEAPAAPVESASDGFDRLPMVADPVTTEAEQRAVDLDDAAREAGEKNDDEA
jgi:hypothetical protein